MFQGGECPSLGHLLRTWPPAISVKTTLRFSHRSETSVCTYSVVILYTILDPTRNSCEKCNYRAYRPSDRNRICGPVIPVQRSNQLGVQELVVRDRQLDSVAQLVRALHRNRRAAGSIPVRAYSCIFRYCSWLGLRLYIIFCSVFPST